RRTATVTLGRGRIRSTPSRGARISTASGSMLEITPSPCGSERLADRHVDEVVHLPPARAGPHRRLTIVQLRRHSSTQHHEELERPRAPDGVEVVAAATHRRPGIGALTEPADDLLAGACRDHEVRERIAEVRVDPLLGHEEIGAVTHLMVLT